MEKYYKIGVEKSTATRITANADALVKKDGIKGYAMMWLHLTNNQRTNSRKLLKVYNDGGNGIYAVCVSDKKTVKATEDYLQMLGLVIENTETVSIITPDEIIESEGELDVELISW